MARLTAAAWLVAAMTVTGCTAYLDYVEDAVYPERTAGREELRKQLRAAEPWYQCMEAGLAAERAAGRPCQYETTPPRPCVITQNPAADATTCPDRDLGFGPPSPAQQCYSEVNRRCEAQHGIPGGGPN